MRLRTTKMKIGKKHLTIKRKEKIDEENSTESVALDRQTVTDVIISRLSKNTRIFTNITYYSHTCPVSRARIPFIANPWSSSSLFLSLGDNRLHPETITKECGDENQRRIERYNFPSIPRLVEGRGAN